MIGNQSEQTRQSWVWEGETRNGPAGRCQHTGAQSEERTAINTIDFCSLFLLSLGM